MSSLFAETALLPVGWAKDVRIETRRRADR